MWLQAGRKMRAYRTILTHFSQRYPRIPLVRKELGMYHGRSARLTGSWAAPTGRCQSLLALHLPSRDRKGKSHQWTPSSPTSGRPQATACCTQQGLDTTSGSLRERPFVAFDGMRVHLCLLPALPKLFPAITAALEEVVPAADDDDSH